MAYCSQCGKQIGDDAPFCGYCGASTNAAQRAKPVVPPHAGPPIATGRDDGERPTGAPSVWRRFRARPMWLQLLAWAGVALVVFAIIGGATGGGSKSHSSGGGAVGGSSVTPAPTYAHKVQGKVTDFALITSDATFVNHVHGDHAWCAWHDGHVWVHVLWHSTLNATVDVSMSPEYRLYLAGTHGDGQGSDQTVTLQPQSSRSWTSDAGAPQGVASGARITACVPTINSIDPH